MLNDPKEQEQNYVPGTAETSESANLGQASENLEAQGAEEVEDSNKIGPGHSEESSSQEEA